MNSPCKNRGNYSYEVGKFDLLARVQTFLLHEIKRPNDAILVITEKARSCYE